MTDIVFDVLARDKASRVFRNVGHAADGTSSSMGKFLRVSAAAAAGLAGVTTAAAVFTYKVGSDYVGSLNKIQALTDSNKKTMKATAEQLEANSDLYAKMGQTTGDAAAGVVELTKAGLSLHDSLKAVNSTMVLAKAGELSVADASTLVANSLNTFSLKAKDAGKIANQLANAANISSADVSDLAESFKYVSPVAAAAGVKMDTVNAILAELSNSGIKASQAGTTLRTFLLNLQAPAAAGAKVLKDLNVSVFDAAGNMKPLPDLIGQLGSKLDDLPAKEKAAALKDLFGKVGIAGATTILKEGKDGLEKYTQGVNRAGAANKLARSQSKGLAGTFASIKAQAISAAQGIYRKFSPELNKRLKDFIQQFKDGKGAGGDFRDALESVRDIAVTLWPAMQKVAKFTGEFLGFLAAHKSALAAFVAAMVGLKGLKVAKSFGGGSAGSLIGGGVQKVFVTNPGFGGTGGGGGPGGTFGKVAKYAGPGTALGAGLGIAGTATVAAATAFGLWKAWQAENNNKIAPRAGGFASAKDARQFNADRMAQMYGKAAPVIKAVATHLQSVNARLGKQSQAMDLVGRSADRAFNGSAAKGVANTTAKLQRLNGVKATQAFDLIGHSASKNSTDAGRDIDILSGKVKGIPGKKVQISADITRAMANIARINYETDHLHNGTIIIRTQGGHVPGEPSTGSGSGGSSGSGASAGFSSRSGRNAARSYMDGLVDGIAGKRMTVQKEMEKVAGIVAKVRDKIANLTATRAGFKGTFTADSIFGTDVTGGDTPGAPTGIAALIAAQQGQADQASQLAADIKTVTKAGLSKSLVNQLRSQGTSGAAALHALASGSPDQIALLNSLNKQTNDSLQAAGMRAGNYTRGGSINADIKRAERQDRILDRLADRLHDLAASEKKGETIIVEIDGEAVITAIKRRNKRKGVQSAGV